LNKNLGQGRQDDHVSFDRLSRRARAAQICLLTRSPRAEIMNMHLKALCRLLATQPLELLFFELKSVRIVLSPSSEQKAKRKITEKGENLSMDTQKPTTGILRHLLFLLGLQSITAHHSPSVPSSMLLLHLFFFGAANKKKASKGNERQFLDFCSIKILRSATLSFEK
jgi:hypothetical protein